MKWCKLYRKLGKQPLKVTQNKDVIVIIGGEEVSLILKFKKDGTPYLISKEEWNLSHCEDCYNYNIGDGYDDINICLSSKCKYYNK